MVIQFLRNCISYFMSSTSKEDKGGINIANSLRPYYVFPGSALLEFPDTQGYIEYTAAETLNDTDWHKASTSRWRIDGASFGVRFNAVPLSWGPIAPSRIEVRIPDQTLWPAKLWSALDARDSVHLNRERVRSLGISSHLIKALTHQEERTSDFRKRYESLPFGSHLMFSRVEANCNDMRVDFVPNVDLAGRMLSAKKLQSMWQLDKSQMPPCIDYRCLKYEKQLAASIILISIPDNPKRGQLVFKSEITHPGVLYHELKVLLTLPAMRNIIQRPYYLVTTQDDSDEPLVCGFLLEYYWRGDLERALPEMSSSMHVQKRVQWAREVTSALKHVWSSGYFYSDLRMDNILLSEGKDGSQTVILADFQQSRNVYNWAPPEIYYVEWIAELGHESFMRKLLPDDKKEQYLKLLNRYLHSRNHSLLDSTRYDNPDQGWYFPWLSSNDRERESAMVYLLGKALWCIFEGVGDADIILGRSSTHEMDYRFPEFRRTPEPARRLIKDCTAGAREWIDGPIRIYRWKGKIFPLGQKGGKYEPVWNATADETKRTIKSFWEEEINKAEAFVLARLKYDNKQASELDRELLHYLRRPSLGEVLSRLEKLCDP